MAAKNSTDKFATYILPTLLGAATLVMAFGSGEMILTTTRIDALYMDTGNIRADLAEVRANTENMKEPLATIDGALKRIDGRTATSAGKFLPEQPLVVKAAQQLGKFLQQNRLKGGVFIVPEDPADWAILKKLEK